MGTIEKSQSGKSVYTFGITKGTIVAKYLVQGIVLPTPTKEGHSFDGWYKGETKIGNAGDTYTPKYNKEGEETLTAKWNKKSYTATFNGNGGTDGTQITKEFGDQLGSLPTSTREGYTFDGWYTEINGGTKINENTTMPARNIDYYAHWNINDYTVTIKAGNGISAVALEGWDNTGTATMTKSLEYGATLDLSTLIPTYKNGYSGSSLTKTSGTGTLSGTTFTVGAESATITVNATTLAAPVPSITTANTTKIFGASNITLKTSQTTTYGSGVSVNYKFGNSTSENGTYTYGNASTATTSSVSATSHYGTKYYKVQAYATDGILTSETATWESSMYVKLTAAKITFNANDGTLNGTSTLYAKKGETTLYTTNVGTTVATVPTASRTGYVFDGWYTAATNGSKVLNADGSFTGTAVSGYTTETAWATTANKTLYARWEKVTLIKSETSTSPSTAKFLYTTIERRKIKNISFATSISGHIVDGNTCFDVSSVENAGQVLLWITNIDENGYYEIVIGQEGGVIANPDSSYLLSYVGYSTPSFTINTNNFDTSNTTNMNSMFANCGFTAMTRLDLGNKFDTSNVTDMKFMFASCGRNAMISLNLGDKFDTSNVTDMRRMFLECGTNYMTSLDISAMTFPSTLTSYDDIFYLCGASNCIVYVKSSTEKTWVTTNKNPNWLDSNIIIGSI